MSSQHADRGQPIPSVFGTVSIQRSRLLSWGASARSRRVVSRIAQNLGRHSIRAVAHLAFPGTHHSPPEFFGSLCRTFVALAVPFHLGGPESGVRPDPRGLPPVLRAAMPKAPIDEHSHASGWQNDVGRTALGQLTVKAEPGACRMKCPAKSHLGTGVLIAAPRQMPTCDRATQFSATPTG